MAFAGAGATHAATFAQYSILGNGDPNISFDRASGKLTAFAPDTTVDFSFLSPFATALDVPATFTMDAKELGAFPILQLSTALFSGNFEFTYAGLTATTYNGETLSPGDVLLQGTFDNAGFVGAGKAGTLLGADTFLGSVTYSSKFYSFPEPDDEDFSIGMTDIDPSVSVRRGALTSFSADSHGSFDADSFTLTQGSPGGIPEPATWLTMIGGLFGMGLMLRRTRQATTNAVAAG
jgi:hypothetical protein